MDFAALILKLDEALRRPEFVSELQAFTERKSAAEGRPEDVHIAFK